MRNAAMPEGSHRVVSSSAFAYLFCEIVQYQSSRIRTAGDLELKLQETGHRVGTKLLELVSTRERNVKRETGVIETLQFISTTCWRSFFGKPADSLERSTDNDNEFMIHETDSVVNRFISVPADLGQLNCAAYTAGILKGMLDCAHFPAKVTAHSAADSAESSEEGTVYLICLKDPDDEDDDS